MSADDLRERREVLGVTRKRASARPSEPSALGCCARVGPSMPVWAPRRGVRCQATPTFFPGFRIDGELVVLPLCVIHHGKLERSHFPERLALEWAP